MRRRPRPRRPRAAARRPLAGRVLGELRAADVLLHPAVSEGFGNAVMEAQAVEVPVVCTDADGLRENVVDGVTGLVVPRRDASALAAALERLAARPRSAPADGPGRPPPRQRAVRSARARSRRSSTSTRRRRGRARDHGGAASSGCSSTWRLTSSGSSRSPFSTAGERVGDDRVVAVRARGALELARARRGACGRPGSRAGRARSAPPSPRARRARARSSRRASAASCRLRPTKPLLR